MANNYLITGYWGEPHVTAENDRGINAAMFGAGRYVLPVGKQFLAGYIGNNTVRVYDGKLIDNGAVAGIPAGEYIDFSIPNASQGMKRKDLIVFEYKLDSATQVESGVFKVLYGTETSGTPAVPALMQSDLLSGTATIDQMALYSVTVSGTAIGSTVKEYELAPNAPSVLSELNTLENTVDDVKTDVAQLASIKTRLSTAESDIDALEESTTKTKTAVQILSKQTWIKLFASPQQLADYKGVEASTFMTDAISLIKAMPNGSILIGCFGYGDWTDMTLAKFVDKNGAQPATGGGLFEIVKLAPQRNIVRAYRCTDSAENNIVCVTHYISTTEKLAPWSRVTLT